MIKIASDGAFADLLEQDKPDYVEIVPLQSGHESRQASSELLLFGLSLAASVPLNLLASWLWSKIEVRKAADPTLRVNVYVQNTRVFTHTQMLQILQASDEVPDKQEER